MLIPGYREGSDITIMNTIYSYPTKDANDNWQPDYISLIYKDNKTGKKDHHIIEKPNHEFYTIKDEYVDKSYQPFIIEKDKCEKHSAPHNSIEKKISELTNNEDFYKNNIRNGARRENYNLHMESNVMFSDTNIEDHYRYRFSKEYKNSINRVYKGYFDIEVDGKYQAGDFPEPGECPVNCCSYLDDKTGKIYTFILRNPENPLIEEFEKSINDDLFKELHDFLVEKVGGWKQATRFGIIDMSVEFMFFDNEISLIKSMFDIFHSIDPDFILVWNMSFDLPYLIARCYELGYTPEEIMCNPSYERQVVKYYIDTRNKNDFAERTDYCNISGNVTFLDQMIQFCSRRKSKIGSYSNFKLDTIGEDVAKVKKLDYRHITNSVVKLPYIDFKTFVFYNIMDVVVQKCIEMKCNDVEYLFAKCIVNNTSYRKAHRQSIYLINRFAAEFYEDGFIIGNNCNRNNEKPSEKFQGAVVGDPTHTDGYSKIHILGRPIMVADNMIDEDYKSLYPSIAIEHNTAPNALIGAIVMPEQVYALENYYKDEKFSRSGEYIEALVSGEILEFSHRYFHLANIQEFLREDMIEFGNMGFMRRLDGKSGGIYFLPKNALKREAINFNYNSNPIYFTEVKDLDYKYYRELLKQKAGI